MYMKTCRLEVILIPPSGRRI